MKANYLFYFCDSIGSVFDSQVLALLTAINAKKIFNKLYLFLGIRNENQKNGFLAREANPEIEIVFFKSYPNYPFFNYMNRKSIKNALISQSIKSQEVIFHSRGEMIAWQLSEILDRKYHNNIIPDVRGAIVEEIAEFTDFNKLLKSFKILNNKKVVKNLNRFQKISVVSNSLKKYLITNYNIETEKIVITPSLAGSDFQFSDEQRDKIRQELKLSGDDILIVFSSGGTAGWQNNDPLNWLADKGFKVLNLSKKEIRHSNIINKFVSYDEMPLYLNAADVAIIWRDKSIVNNVASPVKFSEYICCGLPVIANRSVNMISEYISKYECGILVDDLDTIDLKTINELKAKNRKIISEDGIKNFGVETIVNKYLQIYSSLNT